MSTVLLTGMTAAQASPAANKRTRSFAAQLNDALVQGGHTVTWAHPEIDWDDRYFDSYDAILVGVAPVLGLASNRSYGALKALETLFYDPRLTLFIDAPNPAQITASLTALENDPSRLIKDFFAKRDGYTWAKSVGEARLLTSLDYLGFRDWPTTLYPKMPWADTRPDWFDWMPIGFIDSAVGVNLDALHSHEIDSFVRQHKLGGNTLDFWVSETMQSAWLNKLLPNLTYGVQLMKSHRGEDDSLVMYGMIDMTGSIIPPQKDGVTWWTPRYIQSLVTGTPVITEWRDSHLLAPEWGVLGGTIEDMDAQSRLHLAKRQLDTYLGAIPDHDTAITQLMQLLKL